ncbi:MAG: PAS domain S-box protein [Opitutae bacterium]|nr:PAS domain S-box protein [Opitutae bacterium]
MPTHLTPDLLPPPPTSPLAEAPTVMPPRGRPWWMQAIAFGLAYLACAGIGHVLVFQPHNFVSFWLPSGLYVAVLLRTETRYWPAFVLAASAANLGFDLIDHKPLPLGLVFLCANGLEAVVGAALIRRFVTPRPRLDNLREVAGLAIFSALGSTALGALVGAWAVTLVNPQASYWGTWSQWWSGDALGVLLVAPVVLSWQLKQFRPTHRRDVWRTAELATLSSGLVLCTAYAFLGPWHQELALKYLVLPFIIWAALRFGLHGVSIANLIMSVLATWLTIQGYGENVISELSSRTQITALQIFLVVATLLGMILAALEAGRRRTEQALRESEARYRAIAGYTMDCESWFDPEGRLRWINPSVERITGYSAEACMARPDYPVFLIYPGDRAYFTEIRAHTPLTGQIEGLEYRIVRKDGAVRWISANWQQVLDDEGRSLGRRVSERDITQRKLSEQHIADALAFNRTVMEASPAGIMTFSAAGPVVSFNQAATNILGLTTDLLQSANFRQLQTWRETGLLAVAEKVLATGQEQTHEARGHTSLGKPIWLSARLARFHHEGQPHLLLLFVDISARKQAEEERQATLQVLELCNQATNVPELMQQLARILQQVADCEAVGVRLRDGPDFPYFATHGFSDEFVRAESSLCLRDSSGQPLGDDAGNPILACMCGNILCGRFDPTKPFFTARGSFWTNSTTQLLASTTEQDRQARTRNRCHGEGYESVALIPLRSHRHTTGLIQLNDRRPGRFTPERIALLENLAGYVTVTATKLEAERALRTSEEHLRSVLEHTHAGYFRLDLAGRIKLVNRAWLLLHGYTHADEVIGRPMIETLAPEERAEVAATFQRALAGEPIPTRELARLHQDGSRGYHTTSAHVVQEEARATGFEGFIIDTTNLHAIRERYQTLFTQMLDGFALHEMIFDEAGRPADYRFLVANPAFERITGLKAEQIVGRRLLEVLPDSERKWIEIYGGVVLTGEPRRFEEYSSALKKHFDILAFRPEPGQFACLIRDVTDRKQLESQFLQAQKMEAVGQLAGGVAHDFNNIISATLMHLSLLQDDPRVPAALKTSLRELETEARRAANLTRQLLLFGRRESMEARPVDLNEVLANLLKMLRRLIGENYQLVFAGGNTAHWVCADVGMLEQVAMNLCVNARDAMPRGGQVTLAVNSAEISTEAAKSNVHARPGRFVCLTVSDTGCGMSEETLKRIFEPFFTTKEAGKGTGLGLATVYGIVQQHRGWVNVESAVDRGTTFAIYLPVLAEPPPTIAPTAEPVLRGGTETILLVEDEEVVRRGAASIMRRLGYRVLEAANGVQALQLWERHASSVDLLFTDMVMPEDMTGLDLVEQLRRQKPGLKAIVASGYSVEVMNQETLAAAGITYLAKPFAKNPLARAVRSVLDQA